MNGLEPHDAAALLPLLDGAVFETLKADIQANGQLEPIRTLGGRILDGRNRYRACMELGIAPRLEEVGAGINPIQFVLSANLYRRHLDESQRAMVGARLLEMEKAAAKKRQRAGGGDKKSGKTKVSVPENLPEPVDKGDARDRAGETVNVSGRSVDHAAKVISQGVPQLVQAVDLGQISVSAASKIAALPKKKQEAVLEEGGAAITKAIRGLKQKKQQAPSALQVALRAVNKAIRAAEEQLEDASDAALVVGLSPKAAKDLEGLAERAERVLGAWRLALRSVGNKDLDSDLADDSNPSGPKAVM